MGPGPESQLVSTATVPTAVSSFTETGQTPVTSVTSPTRLPCFLLTLIQKCPQPDSVDLFSHLSKSQAF